jgi:hypothetical protein
LDVLACLADKPLDDKYVNAEFEAIKDTVLEQEQATFRDLFTMDENRHFHRVMLAYCNQVLQQITGKPRHELNDECVLDWCLQALI